MALTETWLKSQNGRNQEKILTKADSAGLSARVSQKGKITFQLRYRYHGKACRLDLGTYPQVTLKQARVEAERMKGVLEQGRDPRIQKHVERTQILHEITFRALYLEFHEKYCVHHKKNAHVILRSFEIYIFPEFGKLPADEITIHMWLNLLEKITKTVKHIADRILINTKQCLNWGIKRQLIKKNPLVGISGAIDLNIQNRAVTRTLDDREICIIWRSIDKSKMSQKNVYFIWLCLFFGCRVGELRSAKKSHFDLKNNIWTIPPENHKTGSKSGKPILRPIIDEIKPILEDTMAANRTEHMFINDKTNKMMSVCSPAVFPPQIMKMLRKKYQIDFEHFSMHDLRRTARTNFSKATQPYVAEIMLGHALPKIQGTYDHYDYLEEQKKAYQWWWARLQEITSEEKFQSHLSTQV